MPDRAPQFFPTLRYRDPAAAIAFLQAAFGFTAHFIARAGEGERDPIVHAQLTLGPARLFLGPDSADDAYGMHSPLALNGTNQCVCVAVENVDALFASAKATGATIVTAPAKTSFGAYMFTVKDPEGHVWSVSDYWGEP